MGKKDALEILVHDLFRLGDYSRWESPKQKENIEWFNRSANSSAESGKIEGILIQKEEIYKHGMTDFKSNLHKVAYQMDDLVIARLNELVNQGADLTEKAYLIANVNSPKILEAALKLGANPNLPGNTGILPVDRAFYKGRTSVAEVLVSSPNFDFSQKGREGKNALFMAVDNGRYKVANVIFERKPEISLERDAENSSILMVLASYLSKNKLNSKTYTFVNLCVNYALNSNHEFSTTEVNKKNQSIVSLCPELASIITEKYALDLEQKLSKKEGDINKAKFKI